MFSCIATQNQVGWVQVSSNKSIYRPRSCCLKTVSLDVRYMETPHLGKSIFIVKLTEENLSAYQGGYILWTILVSSQKTTPWSILKTDVEILYSQCIEDFPTTINDNPGHFLISHRHMNSVIMKMQRIQRAVCSVLHHVRMSMRTDTGYFEKLKCTHYFSPFEV